MLVARRFVIRGRVQGVGYRFFAEDSARHEGLSGWVMNRADGHVEALAEGERDAVERFERRLRRGPAGGRVDAVEVIDDVPSGHWTGFARRHN